MLRMPKEIGPSSMAEVNTCYLLNLMDVAGLAKIILDGNASEKTREAYLKAIDHIDECRSRGLHTFRLIRGEQIVMPQSQ